ncbi:MAG: DUF2209 domain-containing protein [Methanothrix sp.]|nr:DUF2209 domain-containing protein [Methanothrix sp.]
MAIDISGRHVVEGRYKMVCAVVSARISPNFIEKIHSVRLVPRVAGALDLNIVADLISKACICLPGTIVAESGDVYNLEIWRVKSILGRDFKYPETIAEMTAIEMAHHISVAGRRLIMDSERRDNKE